MHTLKKNVIVPYSTHQMFELVDDVEDYHRFLPWCSKSHIDKRTEKEVVATLTVSWKGIHKSLTTRNRLYPNDRIEISLVNGPLHRLDGIWTFSSLNGHACKVSLDMEFEFTGRFIDKLFQPIFQHIANTLVDAFIKRAVDVYGAE